MARTRTISLSIILAFIVISSSSCIGYSHYREFKPVNGNKISDKEDLHPIWEEIGLYYRLLVMAIPLERKCVDYSWRETKMSQTRYFIDYTFWNTSNDNREVSVSNLILILDYKDTLKVSDYFTQSWITAVPYKAQSHDNYFVIARNGLHGSFYDIAPIIKTDGVYAAKATEYYSDENGFEIPPGTESITAITTFNLRIDNEIVEIESVISLKFRDGKKLGIHFA